METRPLETAILRQCLDYLRLRGVFAWRANQAAVPLAGGGFRRFNGMRGVSDILGILPQVEQVYCDGALGKATFGNLLAVEVKRPGGKLSPDQEEFLQAVNDRGGIGLCVHSVDELEAGLADYL